MMDRRRALMGAQGGNENMVPGKTITINNAITKGDNCKTVLNATLASEGITNHGVALTTKKKSSWASRELVCFVFSNGTVSDNTVYRKNNTVLQSFPLTSTYDVVASAGQTFYLMEVVQ